VKKKFRDIGVFFFVFKMIVVIRVVSMRARMLN
jgi:hypothetical protein